MKVKLGKCRDFQGSIILLSEENSAQGREIKISKETKGKIGEEKKKGSKKRAKNSPSAFRAIS